MSYQQEEKDQMPDLTKLHLYTKTAPAVLESNLATGNRHESSHQRDLNTTTTSPGTSSPIYHGLPNISADLQARVLAFQEKRQAASNSQHDQLHSLQDSTNVLGQQAREHRPEDAPKQTGSRPAPAAPSAAANSLPVPPATQKRPDVRKKLSLPAQAQKSPEKPTATTSAAAAAANNKRIAPPMRLPPSLPPVNSPTSISQPLLNGSNPQAAARLPRSRPSLSQRRGMKLNVSDLTSDDGSNDRQRAQQKAVTNNSSSSSLTASKMVTSSSTSSVALDTKKKPVAEFIGERGQLSSQQQQPKLQGLFANYSKYVDIKSGSLNFSGKASLHSKGIDFSGGSSFRISIEELEFIEELGRGNYGTVSKVLHKPTQIVMAMKEVRLELDDSKFRQILMELEVLHNCDSSYIVDFYGAFFVEGAVYMCIEYMNLSSLDKVYGKGIPEPQLAYVAKCVIRGLKQLKDEQNIIHRDVKPTNILLNDQGKVKLCDFGVSGNLVMSMARTNIGCQSYMAPERIKSANPDDVSYSVQSDIWSLGLTLLEAAQGEYPLVSENIFAQLKQIVEDDPPQLDPSKFSSKASDFVNACLVKDPLGRSTYAELLEHPWLTQFDDDDKSEADLKAFLSSIKPR